MPHTRSVSVFTSHVRYLTHQLHSRNRSRPLADSFKRVMDSSASDFWVNSLPDIDLLLYSLFCFFKLFWIILNKIYPWEYNHECEILLPWEAGIGICFMRVSSYILVSFPSRPVSQQLWLTSLFPAPTPFCLSTLADLWPGFVLSNIELSGRGATYYM